MEQTAKMMINEPGFRLPRISDGTTALKRVITKASGYKFVDRQQLKYLGTPHDGDGLQDIMGLAAEMTGQSRFFSGNTMEALPVPFLIHGVALHFSIVEGLFCRDILPICA